MPSTRPHAAALPEALLTLNATAGASGAATLDRIERGRETVAAYADETGRAAG